MHRLNGSSSERVGGEWVHADVLASIKCLRGKSTGVLLLRYSGGRGCIGIKELRR
jgi:hypothetical protein